MVNIILGNKGGIGKSTISALIAEYQISQNKKILCVDLDPENVSFYSFNSLKVEAIQIKDTITNDIDKRKIDALMEFIFDNKDKEIIIDTGSTSYTPLTTYFIENDFFSILNEEEIEHRIISIIHGGGNTYDSINGMKRISEMFPNEKLLIVNNQLQASTIVQGKVFEETNAFLEIKDRITGIVNIPKKSDYITEDIVNMRQESLLFSDLKTSEFTMMQRRRLTIYRDEIWAEFEKAGL